ncbi:glycosyltransferase [Cryomorpha ignava]|uniref:Glycosyltransferase n=2 Tax=Cryomorpha ignava TaxID=101383 RepID=A0A7K3WM56_9FLAO|nr:glycosyltransferase [Cryomorpha ignava]
MEVIFVAAAAIQLFFYLYFYLQVATYRRKEGKAHTPPVSVIIAARNEYDNLAAHLPSILEQDYPNFEVVVVNDGSWDETEILLEEFQKRYSNLKVVIRPANDYHDAGKKLAITLGIKGAKHERLLFTDADCRPVSRQWIQSMIAEAQGDTLVLGYSPYSKTKGFLNRIIRADAYLTAMNYMGFALAGIPYMGVGRNLSYSKTSFFKIGGFKKHYSIASGDDDLFVNEVANKTNTVVCLEKNGVVESLPEAKWKFFWRQKRRHLYTGRRYKRIHKLLLVLQPISYLMFTASAVVLLVFHKWLYIVIMTLSFRVLLQFFIFRRSSQRLGQTDLLIFIPLLEFFVVMMNGFIHIANAFAKPNKWKN